MGAVSYTIKAFDPEEAASGALCIVLNGNTIGGSAISFTGETPNNTVTEESLIGSESNSGKVLLGTGICKRRGDLFTITINSTNYTFNSDGTGYSGTARSKYLYRCEVVDTTTVTNNVVSTTKKITRGDNGAISTETLTTAANILIENLTARDEFAAQALRGILGRIDNPSVLSKDELKFYCDAAYKWAEGMLQEAAKSRAVGSITTVSGTSTSSYSDNTEALLAQIASAIGNISISGGSGGSIDTATLVAVLDKMLYTIKSEGRWHYHTAIDKNDSGQFKFVYRPIYGRAQVKLEYYDSNGNLLPESTVTNWVGKRYTASNDEIDDGGNLIKTYSQLIDMIMTDSAVADSEGYYYKATPQYPTGSNVIVASVKVFVDVNSINVSGGGSVDTSGIVEKLNDLIITYLDESTHWHYYETISISPSEDQCRFYFRTVYAKSQIKLVYYDTNDEMVPITEVAKWTGKRYKANGQGYSENWNPFSYRELIDCIVVNSSLNPGNYLLAQAYNSSNQTANISYVKIYIDTSVSNTEVSFASGASLALENAEDSNNDPKPIIVESVIKNSPSESDPTINVPLEVDSIPWTMLGEYSGNGEITIPNILSSFEYVKVIPYNNGTAFSSEYRCDVEWYDPDEEIDVYRERIVIGSLGYQKFPSNIDNLTVSLNESNQNQTLTSLVVYVAGNVGVSGGGGSTSTNREVSFASGATLNVSMPGYLPLSGGTLSSTLGIATAGDRKLVLNNTDNKLWNIISFQDNGTEVGYLGLCGSNALAWNQHAILLAGYDNDIITHGNEFTFVSAGYGSDVSEFPNGRMVWFNYRTASGNTDGNISSYKFGDGKGGELAEISNGQFSGNAASATYAGSASKASLLIGTDRRDIDTPPASYLPPISERAFVYSEFAKVGGAVTNNYEQRITFAPWDDSSGGLPTQISFVSDTGGIFKGMFLRSSSIPSGSSTPAWDSWEQIATSSNSFVKVGGKLLENITFSGVDDVVNGLVFYYGNTNIGKFGVTKNGNNYYLSWTPNSGTAKKVLFEGDAPSFSFYASTSGGESVNMNNTNGLSMKVRSVSSGVYALDYLPLSGDGTVNALNAKTIGVLNSNDTNGVYIHWDSSGYLNIHGDTNPPRGYIFDAPVTQSSDIRLKDVISHEVLGVNEIAEMPLVKFSWKEDKEKKVHFGTIAQDWEEVIPEVISEGSDGMKAMDYGAAAMAAGVTACREIVELKEENKELKKTVEYLKKELEAIKEIVYGKKENDMED